MSKSRCAASIFVNHCALMVWAGAVCLRLLAAIPAVFLNLPLAKVATKNNKKNFFAIANVVFSVICACPFLYIAKRVQASVPYSGTIKNQAISARQILKMYLHTTHPRCAFYAPCCPFSKFFYFLFFLFISNFQLIFVKKFMLL